MIRRQNAPAVDMGDAGGLAGDRIPVPQVFEGQLAEDEIERPATERQRVAQVSPAEGGDAAVAIPGDIDHPLTRVDADQVGASFGQQRRVMARPRPGIEDAAAVDSGQQRLNHRPLVIGSRLHDRIGVRVRRRVTVGHRMRVGVSHAGSESYLSELNDIRHGRSKGFPNDGGNPWGKALAGERRSEARARVAKLGQRRWT